MPFASLLPLMPFLPSADDLAVVPIVANVGAAILPAIIGSLSSVAAVLFNPKALWRVCTTKPHIPILVVAAGVGLWFAVGWLMAPPAPNTGVASARVQTSGASSTDWTQVALAMLAAEERAKRAPPSEVAGAAAAPSASTAAAPAATAATAAPVEGQAMQYRGSFSRSAWDGGPAPTGLKVAWTYNEEQTMFLSSPLMRDGVVYGASAYLDPPNSYGAVVALDAATGALKWRTESFTHDGKKRALMGFFSSPALSADGKSLLIGQGLHFDPNAHLVCLDTQTGAVRWTIASTLHIECSPAISGDLVVIGAGAIEDLTTHKAMGDPGHVIAARISTGEELWRFPMIDPESSPIIMGDLVIIGSGINGKAVVALRTGTDAELKAKGQQRLAWSTPTPHPAVGSVTAYGDLALIGIGNGDFVFAAKNPEGFVVALDRATGTEAWRVQMPDAVLGPIAVVGDVAIAPVRNGDLVALDLKAKGKVLWRLNDPKQRLSKKGGILAGPAFTGNLVYALSQDGFLGIFDATTGQQRERLYLNDRARPGELGLTLGSPMVAGGKVYLATETGGIVCLTGTP